MQPKTAEDIHKIVKDRGIDFIQLWFTDILGMIKGFTILPSELEEAMQEGMGFDGSSIEGFARIEESDMIAKPDLSTFEILPWEDPKEKAARMYCDILNPDGSNYDGDPRYALRRAVKKAADLGYTYYVGPELEFFLFKDREQPEIFDHAGYFDTRPLDMGSEIRRDIVISLQRMGIWVEYSHHEVAPSQHEIDLRYDEALRMADKTMTYRNVAKEVARQQGYFASFMPKPLFGVNGNGMHVHQSLFKDGSNAFFDPDDPHFLSPVAKGFMAGILKHAKEITAVTNQWVNSYKRLVPGYEAPVYAAWAQRNRSAMIRVPMYKPGKEEATRIEFRSPDPACNPYLAFAVMLAAGLKGVQENYPLADPVERDIYEMTDAERREVGIDSLPGNQFEAIQELENSELVRETLGDHIFYKFIENKKLEWNDYSIHVSQHEIERLYPIL